MLWGLLQVGQFGLPLVRIATVQVWQVVGGKSTASWRQQAHLMVAWCEHEAIMQIGTAAGALCAGCLESQSAAMKACRSGLALNSCAICTVASPNCASSLTGNMH